MFYFGMFGLGATEIGVILLIALLLFGAKRIPEIARGLGKGIREFRSATSEISRELTLEERRTAYTPPPTAGTTYAHPPQPEAPSAQAKPTQQQAADTP